MSEGTKRNKYDIAITPAVVAWVRRQFPSAVRATIRAEGKCPDCKRAGLVSLQLPSDWDRPVKDGMESAGFFCVLCGWGNAGSREIKVESE